MGRSVLGRAVRGAITAAVVLLGLLGDVGHLGASVPLIAPASAVLLEVLLTAILVTVIVGTADRFRIVGTESAIAVGATIALCGLFGGALSGASMNPARSLGPALVGGDLANAWIYVLGPVAGASLAVLVTMLLHGFAPGTTSRWKRRRAPRSMEPPDRVLAGDSPARSRFARRPVFPHGRGSRWPSPAAFVPPIVPTVVVSERRCRPDDHRPGSDARRISPSRRDDWQEAGHFGAAPVVQCDRRRIV